MGLLFCYAFSVHLLLVFRTAPSSFPSTANFIMRNSAFHVAPQHFMTKSFHARTRILFSFSEGSMSNNILVDLSMEFSVAIVNLCDSIKGKSILTNQILRSGTSIGANIHEANYAQTPPDFVSKLQIALKECYETEYWLTLFSRTGMIDENTYKQFKTDCGKIRRILISSINTAKEHHQRRK